jgi:peptidoglycan-N-acetylglucosamine deacetylase
MDPKSKTIAGRVVGAAGIAAIVSAAILLSVGNRAAQAPDPAQTVRDYYAAVAKHDCTTAIKLRPSYTFERCRDTTNIKLASAETKYNQDNVAVVQLSVTYQLADNPKAFDGFVKLTQVGDTWTITESFLEASKGDLDAYLKKYVTGSKNKTDNGDLYLNYRANPDNPATLDPVSGLAFGSSVVLHACWTPTQLEGSPEDRKVIGDDPHTDRGKPARLSPKHKLPPLQPERRNDIRYVKPNGMKKIIALTFDLCERTKETTGYDSAIVNYLRAQNIKATFFAGGKWMRSHPDKAMQIMSDPRFELGNHGWTHGNVRVLTGDTMKAQIDWTQAEYELLREELIAKPCAQKAGEAELAQIPASLLLFRPPYGACDEKAMQYLADSGLATIQWSVVTGDPAKEASSDGIAKIVLAQAKPGAIVIMHANGRGHGTAEALPKFIPELRQQGYQFVTVSELLSLGIPFAPTECYENNPGDNLVYDRKFGDGT